MKYLKIAFVVLIIGLLIFGGYKGYNYYKEWKESKIEVIKTITEVVPEKTYTGLKEEVLELKKDEEKNKEEIEKLREALSVQRKAFLASDDTILVKTTNDETVLLYRDAKGELQAGSDNIRKIIEHRDVVILPEEISIHEKNWDIKVGGYYSLIEKEYGLILSKEILGIKPYSLNVSLLSDLKNLEGINLGANLNYEIKKNLQLGVGMTIDKNYYICIEYNF